MPFTSLGFASELLPPLLRALEEKGYAAPTAIQAQAIPAILAGRDVVGSARTGSGKTAAFALPLLQQYAHTPSTSPRHPHALVLVPTRELAAQVGVTFIALGRFLPGRLRVATLFGGVSINPQMMALRGGADIVVATPGRLLNLVARNALRLSSVATLVLDEADRLLDLGFGEELSRLLALLPPRRQTLFFSATFPPVVEAMVGRLLHDPLRIGAGTDPSAAPDIRQRAIEVDPERRTQLLRHLIQEEGWSRVLVFVATKHAADAVSDKLCKAGILAEPFHGELSQGRRTRILQDFKQVKLRVLVATDVAARGIDIAQLPAVVNYDLPRSAVDYTHRIGRTGRAGETGLALCFVSAGTQAHLRLIEKRHGLRLPRERIAGFEPEQVLPPNPADPSATGGIKGVRPSKKDRLRAAALAAQGNPAA